MFRRFRSRSFKRESERGEHAARRCSRGHGFLFLVVLIAIASGLLLAQETPPAADPQPAAPTEPSAEPPQPAAGETALQTQPATPPPPKADPFALDFLRLCAGCHTIGGGALTGPDLLPATKWPRPDLRVAVKRMEKNVGPMSDEQVDGLTDLLQSPDLQARLNVARERRIEEMAATLEPGQPAIGRQLFFGEQRLANGGVACFGCHTAGGRGGNMAKDLTMVHQRLGEPSLLSATEKPAFPMMVAAYTTRPVTPQEAAHLAAFFKETAAATPPEVAAQPQSEALGIAHAGAGGLFLVVLAGVAVLARRRRAGVRARMVRDSQRR